MKAVIMAGGKGTRLRDMTLSTPKPMIEIAGKPVLQYQIESLKRHGIMDIIIIIGYLGDRIKNYFSNGQKYGVNISYIEEEIPLGTAGALYYLKKIISEDFLLIYADVFQDVNLYKFIDFHKQKNALATLLVHPNSHPYDSDLVILNRKSRVIDIDFRGKTRDYYYKNCSNSGLYILNNKIFDYISDIGEKNLEKDIIYKVIKRNERVYGYKTTEYAKDIGTYERLERAITDFNMGIVGSKNLSCMQKCIFTDRDGTINKYWGLIHKPDDFHLEKDVTRAIKMINNSGFLCIVITNQPVIAMNLCTMEQLDIIHKKLETMLGYNGAYLDDILYCPHYPVSGYANENKEYKIDCNCRKPKIGLIEKCVEKYNIDISNSYFMGDSTTDIMTGINAGLKTVLVQTGVAGMDKKFDVLADYTFKDLFTAVNTLLNPHNHIAGGVRMADTYII